MAKKRPVSQDTSSTSPDSTGKQPAPPPDPIPKAPAQAAKTPARKTPAKTAAAKPRSDKKIATPGPAKPGTSAATSKPKPPARTRRSAAPAPPAEASTPAPAEARKPAPRAAAKRATSRRPVPTRGAGRAADTLDIVMVASEMHPFATSGGLSEVLGALPQALTRLGHRVTAIIPRYRRVATGPNIGTANPTPHRAEPAADVEATIDMGQRQFRIRFYATELGERLSAVFVDVPELFDRDGLYGNGDGDYPDNAIRFAVFSRAALEYLRLRGRRPSVIHAHDWQAGLVPAYQKMLFSPDPVIGGVPVVFTIHNLAFQGIFPVGTLDEIGLPARRAARRGDGVLRPHQLPEGRHQLQRADHHGQPDLCARDPRAPERLRFRGCPRAPLGGPARHPQRHRRRPLESGHGLVPAGALQRRRSGRQGGGQAFPARGLRSRRHAGSPRASAHRAGLAADRSERASISSPPPQKS